jgi:molybdopterin-guanine dinucleotide biosynthesis protein A
VSAGLLLLTGGQGRRFGAPKHTQPHPAGGTWGGHLVEVFRTVFPGGPLRLLGETLPDHLDLPPVRDPGQGPAAALLHWAAQETARPERWWVVACDQVRWTPEALNAWYRRALSADPEGIRWVLARVDDHPQFLGGFLGGSLPGAMEGLRAASLWDLSRQLPAVTLHWPSPCWTDVDTPEALKDWLG